MALLLAVGEDAIEKAKSVFLTFAANHSRPGVQEASLLALCATRPEKCSAKEKFNSQPLKTWA